jgi:hypothetical protein
MLGNEALPKVFEDLLDPRFGNTILVKKFRNAPALCVQAVDF